MDQEPEEQTSHNVFNNEEVHNISLTEAEEEVFPPLCIEVATVNQANETDSLELEKLKIELQAVREELQSYKMKTTSLTEELQKLKGEFQSSTEKSKKSDFFERCQSSDFWMKTYTSLNTFTLFESLFLALEPAVIKSVHVQALPFREQLFLTLVKLTHDVTEDDLAFRFKISQSTVSRYFQKWINIIDQRLSRRMIHWQTEIPC